MQTIRTATFHKAVASDPGCTSNNRCLLWPEANCAVLELFNIYLTFYTYIAQEDAHFKHYDVMMYKLQPNIFSNLGLNPNKVICGMGLVEIDFPTQPLPKQLS